MTPPGTIHLRPLRARDTMSNRPVASDEPRSIRRDRVGTLDSNRRSSEPPSLSYSAAPMRRILIMAGLALAAFAAAFAATRLFNRPPPAPSGMVWIPGGEFTMGSDASYALRAEGPAHRVRVDGFFMDETDVTNAQFAEFVKATGYVT